MKIMFDTILRKLKTLYPDFQNIMILFYCKIDFPRKGTLPNYSGLSDIQYKHYIFNCSWLLATCTKIPMLTTYITVYTRLCRAYKSEVLFEANFVEFIDVRLISL